MDDFVVNVRQIGQYPQITPQPGDLVLLQQGGLGGAYAASRVTDLVFAGLNNNILTVPAVELPADGALVWNDTGKLQFGPSGWSFDYLTGGLATALFTFNLDGSLQLPFNTIQVARDPFEPFEVATRNFVTNNTVASFNGRTGAVCLTDDDVHTAFGVPAGDTLATQAWVNATICASVPDFIYQNPFVYTWNGRVGDVQLTLADVEQAFFASPGSYPTAPSPALGDSSNKIATTQFVDDSLEDWATLINTSWNAADYELLNIIQTQYAPLNSPALTGVPSAPTPPPGASDGRLATTAFVMHAVTASTTGVISFNSRTGVVSLTAADVFGAGGALINSPVFTGNPTVPLAPAADNSASIASTAWVQQEIAAVSSGVTSWNGRSGIVNLQASDLTLVGGALLASPAFSGIPTAPTAAPGTSTTQLATTAFVMANNGVVSFNGRTGAVSLQTNDISAAGGAVLASPAFTGTPTAPTAAPGTNTTQLATTAFVLNQLSAAQVVSSFNSRTGAVTLTTADITNAGGATTAYVTAQLVNYLPLTGGTLTGALSLHPASGDAILNLNKSTATQYNNIVGQTNGVQRWNVVLGSNAAETGNNAGSDFSIIGCNDAGAGANSWSIARATGSITQAQGNYTMAGTLQAGGLVSTGGLNSQSASIGGTSFTGAGALYCTNIYISAGGQTPYGWVYNGFGTNNMGLYWSGGTIIGAVDGSGQGMMTPLSDASLKYDIEPSVFDGLALIERIPLFSFRWRRDDSYAPFGFVANRLAEVDPALAICTKKGIEDGTLMGVNINSMLAALTRAVQELSARTRKLENGDG